MHGIEVHTEFQAYYQKSTVCHTFLAYLHYLLPGSPRDRQELTFATLDMHML